MVNLYNYLSEIPYICIGRGLTSSIMESALELGPGPKRLVKVEMRRKYNTSNKTQEEKKRTVQRKECLVSDPNCLFLLL